MLSQHFHMDNDNRHLLQPLISSSTSITTTTTTGTDISSTPFPVIQSSSSRPSSSNSNLGIISRLVLVFFIGIVSIWGNHEASKGFSISIVNEARETSPGKRFDVFYVSNDEASRLILRMSQFVENFLYPDITYPKKQVGRVTLRLSSLNLSQPVIVDSREGRDHDQFVLHLSPSILEGSDFRNEMFVAVQHGMVRLWLWDGLGNAPLNLVNGIVDYVSNLGISGGILDLGSFDSDLTTLDLDGNCWKRKDAKAVAQFLNYCELKKPGFIRRLNQAMRSGWQDRMVDEALGMDVHFQVPS